MFPHPIHVCCERQQLLLMALYYSFVLTVAFNQWIEETKQMKACFLFIEGIISVALNVGNNFRLYCMGKNTFLRGARNEEVSHQEHGKSDLLKNKKTEGVQNTRMITLGKNPSKTGRGAELSNEPSTFIHLSLIVHPWKAHGTALQRVSLFYDS